MTPDREMIYPEELRMQINGQSDMHLLLVVLVVAVLALLLAIGLSANVCAAEMQVTAEVVDQRQREVTELRAGASDRHRACVEAFVDRELRERCLKLADKALDRESK